MQGTGTITAYRRPCGYQQIAAATLTAATKLTVPTGPNGQPPTYAVIQCNGGAVRWRDDGSAPTSSIGMSIPTGSELDYYGDLSIIQFIASTSSPVLDITYYA